MGVDRAREHRYQHHTIVTNRGHPGDGQIRILVADDNMVADSEHHPGAGIAHRRMSQAVSVGAEVVNPQIPRHHAASVRRSAGLEAGAQNLLEVQGTGAVDRGAGVLSCPLKGYSGSRRGR